MKNVLLTVKRKDQSFMAMETKEQVALEIGKCLVFTFEEYESAVINSLDDNSRWVIDKDIPDWANCEPVD